MILFAIGFALGVGVCLLAVLLFVWHVAGRNLHDEARWAEEMAERAVVEAAVAWNLSTAIGVDATYLEDRLETATDSLLAARAESGKDAKA